jgi:hypothetical protein
MPRPVSFRVSYGPDAAYLLRLQSAVKKDTRRSDAWMSEVLQHLNKVTTLFLKADAENLDKDETTERAAKNARRLKAGREIASSTG